MPHGQSHPSPRIRFRRGKIIRFCETPPNYDMQARRVGRGNEKLQPTLQVLVATWGLSNVTARRTSEAWSLFETPSFLRSGVPDRSRDSVICVSRDGDNFHRPNSGHGLLE